MRRLAGPALDRHRHGGEPAEGRRPAARCPARGRHPLAPGQPPLPQRRSTCRFATPRSASAGRPDPGARPRHAGRGGPAAPADGDPAGPGAGLRPPARRRDPLPAAVPDLRRAGAGGRCRRRAGWPRPTRLPRACSADRRSAIAGQDVVDLFDAASTRALEAQFAALRATGQAEEIRAALSHGRGEVTVSASLFRGEGGASVLMRLVADPAVAGKPVPTGRRRPAPVIEAMPEGFVVTDPSRRILIGQRRLPGAGPARHRGTGAGRSPRSMARPRGNRGRRPCSRRWSITVLCAASPPSSAAPSAASRTWRSPPSRWPAPALPRLRHPARPAADPEGRLVGGRGRCRARSSRWPNWSAASR